MGTDITINVLWAALLGYGLGSIPFGLILTRIAGAGDVRAIGSGNIGATNVLRTGHKGLAAATLLLDALKGFAAVTLAWIWFWQDLGWTALFAIVGHCFPIWLGFRGGKGVATAAGVSLGIAWPIGLAYALVWLATLAVTRISSLAGMSAVVAAVIAAWVLELESMVPVLALIAALVIFMHRENIKRLLDGSEPKVGSSK